MRWDLYISLHHYNSKLVYLKQIFAVTFTGLLSTRTDIQWKLKKLGCVPKAQFADCISNKLMTAAQRLVRILFYLKL